MVRIILNSKYNEIDGYNYDITEIFEEKKNDILNLNLKLYRCLPFEIY